MTHSILMTIKVKEYEDVKEIRRRIVENDDDSWLTMFGLKEVPKSEYYPHVQTIAGMPPFICFPDKNELDEDDNKYHIIVESGSHCSFYDTKESLMMWVSWFCFIQELESYGIDFTYRIGTDSDREKFNLKEAFKEIIKDSELKKYVS